MNRSQKGGRENDQGLKVNSQTGLTEPGRIFSILFSALKLQIPEPSWPQGGGRGGGEKIFFFFFSPPRGGGGAPVPGKRKPAIDRPLRLSMPDR